MSSTLEPSIDWDWERVLSVLGIYMLFWLFLSSHLFRTIFKIEALAPYLLVDQSLDVWDRLVDVLEHVAEVLIFLLLVTKRLREGVVGHLERLNLPGKMDRLVNQLCVGVRWRVGVGGGILAVIGIGTGSGRRIYCVGLGQEKGQRNLLLKESGFEGKEVLDALETRFDVVEIHQL